MSKLKSFRYPDLEPDEAVRLIKKIVESIGSTTAPQQAIAAAIKMSFKSSGFKIKLADLVQYGLLDGRGSFKATDLAQRLAVGDKTAYKDMMEKIPLFKSIYDNLAGQEAPTDITPYLMTITKCDRIDAEKNKDKIRNIYNTLLQKINVSGNMQHPAMPGMPSSGMGKPLPPTLVSTSSSDKITLVFPSGDSLSLEQTPEDIDILISKLTNLKNKLGKKDSKSLIHL